MQKCCIPVGRRAVIVDAEFTAAVRDGMRFSAVEFFARTDESARKIPWSDDDGAKQYFKPNRTADRMECERT